MVSGGRKASAPFFVAIREDCIVSSSCLRRRIGRRGGVLFLTTKRGSGDVCFSDSRQHMSSWQAREYRSVKFVFAHERPGRPLSHTMEMLLLSADGKTNHGTRISSDVFHAIVAYRHAFDKFDNRHHSKLVQYGGFMHRLFASAFVQYEAV